jgi:hypothetical protein
VECRRVHQLGEPRRHLCGGRCAGRMPAAVALNGTGMTNGAGPDASIPQHRGSEACPEVTNGGGPASLPMGYAFLAASWVTVLSVAQPLCQGIDDIQKVLTWY